MEVPKPLSQEWVEEPLCKYVKKDVGNCEAQCNHPDHKPPMTRCPPIFYVRAWCLCPDYVGIGMEEIS